MVFRNERTWQTAVDAGRQEEFHAAYEAGVAKVAASSGRTIRSSSTGRG